MKQSTARILTTHVGRLQRPEHITAAMEAHPRGRPTDAAFAATLQSAVADIVRQQADAGVDIVNDGEFGKLGWNAYLNGRLSGFEQVPAIPKEQAKPRSRERVAYAEFYAELERGGAHYYRSPGRNTAPGMRWACTGPIRYSGQEALAQDLDCLKAAMGAVKVEEAFIPSTSPIRPGQNLHYADDMAFYEAVGEAMREEYRAIVDAGFILQIDDPHLPDLWGASIPALGLEAYRKLAMGYVDIINHALRGIPEDRIRYHICWGSWHGPHVDDLPMKDIVDILLKVRAQGYAIEAANARHEHEWALWKEVKLPAGKVLIPGVVAHATNVVEHPELVAARIRNFAGAVGRENVIAGTDCGLGYRVHPQIAWAKLNALAEGARLASKALWSK